MFRGGPKSEFQADCSHSPDLGFGVSSFTLYLRPASRARLLQTFPRCGRHHEAELVRRIRLVCGGFSSASRSRSTDVPASPARNLFGPRASVLYPQAVYFGRSFSPAPMFPLCSILSFLSLRKGALLELLAFDSFSSCFRVWDLGCLPVLLKMEFAFLFISPFLHLEHILNSILEL